jgi:hypothetical protein
LPSIYGGKPADFVRRTVRRNDSLLDSPGGGVGHDDSPFYAISLGKVGNRVQLLRKMRCHVAGGWNCSPAL